MIRRAGGVVLAGGRSARMGRAKSGLDDPAVDLALPTIHGFRQPLAAAYRTTLRTVIDAQLAAGNLRVGALLEHCTAAQPDESALPADPAVAASTATPGCRWSPATPWSSAPPTPAADPANGPLWT